MRIELSVIEKTEQYLMGMLTGQEKVDFERSIQQNNELKQQVDFQSQLIEGIQNLALKKSASEAFKTYKFRRLLVVFGFVLVLISALLLSVYFWPEPLDTMQNNQPDMEGSSEAVEFSPGSEEVSEQVFQTVDSVAETNSIIVTDSDLSSENIVSEKNTSDNSVFATDKLKEGDLVSSNMSEERSVPSPIVALAQDDEPLYEWVITRNTSEKELRVISDEIESAGGSLKLKKVSYKSGYLDKISFVVMNKSGEVYYASESLGKDGKVCIRFGEKTISAGWCGEENVVE